jgi:hypothetical protein
MVYLYRSTLYEKMFILIHFHSKILLKKYCECILTIFYVKYLLNVTLKSSVIVNISIIIINGWKNLY